MRELALPAVESALTSVGAAAADLFPANLARHSLYIRNTHATQTLTIRFGADAAAGSGVLLAAAGGQLLLNGAACPSQRVSAIGSGAATTLYAYET